MGEPTKTEPSTKEPPAAASSQKQTAVLPSKDNAGDVVKNAPTKKPLVEAALFKLTDGIPRMELRQMMSQAQQCEQELLQEIQLLENSLNGVEKKPAVTAGNNAKSNKDDLKTLMESPLTPLDRCFTLSALVGRLRDDLALPFSSRTVHAATTGPPSKKKKSAPPTTSYKQLVEVSLIPMYTQVQDQPTVLLNLWKKIASHRSAAVFRRPVKPEEAPGYADRILFPMDLSLVRKMIVARICTTYQHVHQKVALICHNCVKYNGRESDYGIVAREFEAMVDDYVLAAVQASQASAHAAQQAAAQQAATTASAPATTTPAQPASATAVNSTASSKETK